MAVKDRHKPGYIEHFKAETYDRINLYLRKDSGIKNAVSEMAAQKGISISAYIAEALRKQLETDGYNLDAQK